MTPSVSVIIPTGRPPGRALLDRAVRSALAQTWRELDVWVIDDASEPPARLTPDIAADPRVNVVRLPNRIGTAAARNVGAERSGGEILAFLDDDDAWVEEKIARQLAELCARGPEVAAVTCASWAEDNNGRRWVARPPAEEDLPHRVLFECGVTPSTVILRRSAFDEVGGFNQALSRFEDWDLWVRVTDRYAFACLTDVLVLRQVVEAPDVTLRFYGLVESWFADRIDRLPRRERDRVKAHHLLRRGTAFARLGQRGAARQAYREAWRLHRSPRLPLYIARTWTGERTWQAARRARDWLKRGSWPGPAAGAPPR